MRTLKKKLSAALLALLLLTASPARACLDANGNIISSVLSVGLGNALGSSLGSVITSLLGGAGLGGLGGLAGGVITGIFTGQVAVYDRNNLNAANEQIKLLQKILAAENISCATLQQLLAAVGTFGPAANSQNPMVNLPLYAGKVFAVYRDTTQTADPTTMARFGGSSLLGGAKNSVTTPNQGQIVVPTIEGGGGNGNGGNGISSDPNAVVVPTLPGAVEGGGAKAEDPFSLSNLTTLFANAVSFWNSMNTIITQINTLFGGSPSGFVSQEQEISSIFINIFGSENPDLQKILGQVLEDKDFTEAVKSVAGTGSGSQFEIIKPEQLGTLLGKLLFVTEENCDGDIRTCLDTTAQLRQTMYNTFATNTFTKNAVRSQNTREEVRELIYGLDDKTCPPTSREPKCISLMRMMAGASSVREDIQANTAAVLTALGFQLKELEALSEANVAQAAPTVLTSSGVNTATGSGDSDGSIMVPTIPSN
jgi:hypothetical protein